MTSAVNALLGFFRKEVPRLESTYCWKIPRVDGFPYAGHRDFAANLKLKKRLHKEWSKATYERKLELARFLVKDWGRIRKIGDVTLQRYVEETGPNPSTPLKGIASFSKILAIAHPKSFAIYDSRVSACLNAIQINAGVKKGLAFNYVPGRNHVIGNARTGQGFTRRPRFSVKTLIRSGWKKVEKDETYGQYLKILSKCAQRLSRDLVELEMALFVNAERQCRIAMRRGGIRRR